MTRGIKTILFKFLNILGYLFVNDSEEKSCVFMRLDAIGDFVLWLTMAQKYRELNPEDRIILICTKSCVEVAQLSGAYDEILVCNKKNIHSLLSCPLEFFKEVMKWSTFKCKRLIVPVYSRTIDDSIVSYLIKSEDKTAIDGDTTGILAENKLTCDSVYNQLIKTSKAVIHELDRNAEFISKLCEKRVVAKSAEVTVDTSKVCDKDYFVIMPGASISWKCWETQKFVDLALKLQRETGYTCVLCGDGNDKELASLFYDEKKLNIIDKVGKTTVIELFGIIQGAKFFVGNDSAGVHIANAVGTKSVAIFHGAHYGRFLPYPSTVENHISIVYDKKECFGCAHGESRRVCYTEACNKNISNKHRFLCMEAVGVEEVLEMCLESRVC